MVIMRRLIILLPALWLLFPMVTAADSAERPRVLHRPVISLEADTRLRLQAQVEGDWRAEALILRLRPAGEADWRDMEFARTPGESVFQVFIPRELVQGPGFEYTILSTDRDGNEHYHFADTDAPHHVNVHGYGSEMLTADRLDAWRGNRSTALLQSRWYRFGSRPEDRGGDLGEAASDRYSDEFWLLEAEYTYRPLQVIYDFRFGIGVMRGRVPTIAGTALPWPGTTGQPGLNYAYSDVNFGILPQLTLGPRILLGANHAGFVVGGGFHLYLGYLSGTHLELAYENTRDVGYRSDIRFHWATVPRVPMALGMEMNSWPYAGRPDSVNLSYDIGVRLTEGTTLRARVGRANRGGSLGPGYILGAGLSQDF